MPDFSTRIVPAAAMRPLLRRALSTTISKPRRRGLQPLLTLLRLLLHVVLFTTTLLVLTRPIAFFHIPPLQPLTLLVCALALVRSYLPPFSVLPLYVLLAAGRGWVYFYTRAKGMCSRDSPWRADAQVAKECGISGAAWWAVVGALAVEVVESAVRVYLARRVRREREEVKERVAFLGERRDSEEEEEEEERLVVDGEKGEKGKESKEWGRFVGSATSDDVERRGSGEWEGFLGMEEV